MPPRKPDTMIFVLYLLFISFGIQAAEVPEVARHIPRDTAHAIFVVNTGQALAHLDTLMQPFRVLSPELDLAKQGEKLRPEVGVNPLTAEGLSSLGIDTAGSAAFFELAGGNRQVAVIPVKDMKLFRTKLVELMKQKAHKFRPKPRRKAGAEVYEVDGGYIGLKGNWCILQPEPATKGPKDGPLMSFIKPGKKLAKFQPFTRAWKTMPEGLHFGYFVNIKGMGAKIDGDMARTAKEFSRMLKGKDRKEMLTRFRKERKTTRKVFQLLSFVESFCMGWEFKPDAVIQTTFLGATRRGRRVLSRMVPAQSGAPLFHQGLVESAVGGGWLSFDLAQALRHFSSLPTYGEYTLADSMAGDLKRFKKMTQIDLVKDILQNLDGPGAIYLLTPPPSEARASADPSEQILEMLRIAMVAKVSNADKIDGVIEKFNTFLKKDAKQLQTREENGASLTVFQKPPLAEMSWGRKGKTVFLALGKGTAQALVKILSDNPWAGNAGTGQVGSGRLDFAVLTESIAGAVSRGIGGDSAAGFRMTVWPMVKQVLSKMKGLSLDARLVKGGLMATGILSLR